MNTPTPNAAPDPVTPPPVKLVLEWRVEASHRPAFEQRIAELMIIARRHALEGSSVLSTVEGEYVVLLRFANQVHLEAWQTAPDALEILRAAQSLAAAADGPTMRTGLETWFALPGHAPRGGLPPNWKMALVTWCALLPQVIVLSFILPSSWPFLVSVAVNTAIPVVALTWWIMPRLTRLLQGWLFVERPSPELGAGVQRPA